MKKLSLLLTLLALTLSSNAFAKQSAIKWEPLIEMDSQVFPSYLLSTAMQQPDEAEDPLYIGDADGFAGISVFNPGKNTRIKLSIKIDRIAEPVEYEATLPTPGATYEVFPEIIYKYDVLQQIKQPFPANVYFNLTVGNSIEQKTKVIRVRSVNECLFGYYDRSGEFIDISEQFAAYVNEDHIWIDQLLREALNTGFVDSFSGCQGGKKHVLAQVVAVWKMLEKRGFRYISIANTSWVSNKVFSQYVRLFDDSVKTSQANCVDGSVLFASILEKIGINSFLVITTDHCFVGFYLDKENNEPAYLETTMLGNARNYPPREVLKNFEAALKAGFSKYEQNQEKFETDDPRFVQSQKIEIKEARKIGIAPVTR